MLVVPSLTANIPSHTAAVHLHDSCRPLQLHFTTIIEALLYCVLSFKDFFSKILLVVDQTKWFCNGHV